MEAIERQRLRDAINRLPGWSDQESRQALFADLAWEFVAGDAGVVPDTAQAAADRLIDLALGAADPGGPRGRSEAGLKGLHGLAEDLREQGVLDLDVSDPPPWGHAPYPGLSPLEQWQAPIFFGRRAETRALLRRLSNPRAPRLLVVSGLLGCGKSSLLRAGLRARLATGALSAIPDAEQWLVSSMSPAGVAADPFLSLTHGLLAEPSIGALDAPAEAAAIKGYGAEALTDLLGRLLADRPGDACWVLVIDPLEELFTAVDAELAGEFLETLLGSLTHPRLRIVATIRADLLTRCYAYPDLVRVFNRGGLYCLGQPDRGSLERMILGPLTTLRPGAAMRIEGPLVARMVDDVQGQHGGLALMADTLKVLYDQGQAGGTLSLVDYEAQTRDGLAQVIARRAEEALDRAGEGARAVLSRLFSHLLRVADDGTASCRRANLGSLAEQPAMGRLIDALAADEVGLLCIREHQPMTVEFAHEALLQTWPTLRHWVERHLEASHTRHRVLEHASAWVADGRSDPLRWSHETLEATRELLADTGLLDELEQDQNVADFLIPKAEWLLAELLCSGIDPVQREEIGLRLSQIGDPRSGVGLVDGAPGMHWCLVPPGQVLIEGHGRFDCSAFRIAAYPVTQCQFEAFLNAKDGFRAPDWWKDLRQDKPMSGRLRRHGNYPATHVSWFEAVAFCRWLSARLGYEVRLPDEWEWQWGAQSGRPGYFYPWGRDWRETHANTDEASVGRVIAVGMYPLGRSAQGVYDLAGNTWEWCRNRYDKPAVVAADPDSTRVLRGGSWRVNMGYARSDFRLDGLPEDRMGGSGFRLVTAALPHDCA